MSNDQDGCEWVSFLLVPAYPGSPGSTAVKRLCVCVLSPKVLLKNKEKNQMQFYTETGR